MGRVSFGLSFVLLMLFVLFVHGSRADAPRPLTAAHTGFAIQNPFVSFWQQGGVQRFGYPISDAFRERNPDDGNIYTVQYFERVRLEYHPKDPIPVKIGRLGAQRLERLLAETNLPPAAGSAVTQLLTAGADDCLSFVQTPYQLCGIFAEYWKTGGGLPIFGYPISNPVVQRTDDGDPLVVQYTERTRFEINPRTQQVTLGLLGRETFEPPPQTEPASSAPAVDPIVEQFLLLINQARAEAGLTPLSPAPELMRAAQTHSEDMATSGIISHIGSDGRGAPQRMLDAGYAWARSGENIAVSQPTPEQAMAFWLNSPPHRANLLDPGMQDVGVGYVQGTGQYGYYWTLTFGER